MASSVNPQQIARARLAIQRVLGDSGVSGSQYPKGATSEWYRELESGRRKAFSSDGSNAVQNYQKFLDALKADTKAQAAASSSGGEDDDGFIMGIAENIGGGLSAAGGAAKSGFDWTMEQLMRTQNAGVNSAFNAIQGKNPLTGLVEGFQNKDTRDPQQRLYEMDLPGVSAFSRENIDEGKQSIQRGVANLAMMIGMDPLTYVGGIGLISKGGKAKNLDEAVAGARETIEEVPTGATAKINADVAAPSRGPSDISSIQQLLVRMEARTNTKLGPGPNGTLAATDTAKATPKAQATKVEDAVKTPEEAVDDATKAVLTEGKKKWKVGDEVRVVIGDTEHVGKVTRVYKNGRPAAYKLPNDKTGWTINKSHWDGEKVSINAKAASETADEAPVVEKYVSPHFDRAAPLKSDGTPRFTKETIENLKKIAAKQLTDELAEVKKAGGAGVTASKESELEFLERIYNALVKKDPVNEYPGGFQAYIAEDASNIGKEYLLQQAQELKMKPRPKVSIPAVTADAIKARAQELGAKLRETELAKESAPPPAPAAPKQAKAPKQEQIEAPRADASDTPAVAKTDVHETKVATAQQIVRELSEKEAAGVQKAIDHYIDLVSKNAPLAKGGKRPRYAFNPAKQRNLYLEVRKNLLATVPGGATKLGAKTVDEGTWHRMMLAAYRIAEEEVAKAVGKVPGDYVGNPLRLSDILDAIPPRLLVTDDIISDTLRQIDMGMGKKGGITPEIQAIIDKARADIFVEHAEKLAPILQQADETAAAAQAMTPGVQADKVAAGIPKQVEAAAKEAGATDSIAKAAGDAARAAGPEATTAVKELDDLARAYEVPVVKGSKETAYVKVLELEERVFEKQRRMLGFVGGVKPVQFLTGKINSSEKFAKLQDQILRMMPEAMGAREMIGTRFMSSYQMADLQPVARQFEAGAESFIRARIDRLEKLFVDDLAITEQQLLAWKNIHPATVADSPAAQKLVDELSHWYGQKGSWFSQNGLKLEDLNDYIMKTPNGYHMQFGVAFKDDLGTTWTKADWNDRPFETLTAFLAGEDLAKHGAKSPVAGAMYDLFAATEKMVAEHFAMKHFGSMFGSTKRLRGPSGAWVEIDHKALQGRYFEPEIAAQFDRYQKMIAEMRDPSSALARKYDEVLSMYKAGLLYYRPAYHTRNAMGDVFLSFLAGVVNPRTYLKAGKVMHYRHPIREGDQFGKPFADIADVANTTGKTPILRKTKWGDVTVDQVMMGYTKFGGAQNINITENLGTQVTQARNLAFWKHPDGAITGVRNMQPFRGRVRERVMGISEYREDYARIAHFLDAIPRMKASSLDEAMRMAMDEVRKFHFDYGDLTKFEIRVMKRLIPFYTWIRKSTPLLIEQFFAQPWKMAVVPKMNYAIAQMTGQDPQSVANPFPAGTEDMFPSWVKDTAATPWFEHNGNAVTGYIPDPFSDMAADFQPGPNSSLRPIEGLLSALTPAAAIPLETLIMRSDDNPNGVQLVSGIPITDQTRYIDQKIPMVSEFGRLTQTSPVAGGIEEIVGNPEPGKGFRRTVNPDDPGSGGPNMVAFLNWLTGLNLQENTPQRQLSAGIEAQKNRSR